MEKKYNTVEEIYKEIFENGDIPQVKEVIKEDGTKEYYWNNYNNNKLFRIVKGNTEIEYKEDRTVIRYTLKNGYVFTSVLKDGVIYAVILKQDGKELFDINIVEKDFITKIPVKVKYHNDEISIVETNDLYIEFDGIKIRRIID